MKPSQILLCVRILNQWFFRLGSAILFFAHFAHAHADPRADQKTAAATQNPPSGPRGIIRERGIASWYGRHWQGRRTASGVRFDDRALTAAHPWLPFATRARVTNLQNGKSVEVIVNDRGPYCGNRIIDLSARAAQAIGMKRAGPAPVLIQAVPPQQPGVAARVEMR